MFSHNASEDHYFTKPEWYNRDRELFRRYLPQIKAVAEEGWQPVTGARCDNRKIVVERFGPGRTKTVYLTVHNPTDEPQRGTLTGDEALLGRPLPAREIQLQPWSTVVVKP